MSKPLGAGASLLAEVLFGRYVILSEYAFVPRFPRLVRPYIMNDNIVFLHPFRVYLPAVENVVPAYLPVGQVIHEGVLLEYAIAEKAADNVLIVKHKAALVL